MSEMYPPPQPNNQDPQYSNSPTGQNPPPTSGAWTQPFQPQQPSAGGPAPSQPYYPQQPPMTPAYPLQPMYPQQQPPVGYPGYAGGGMPTPPAYVRTNVSEYWKNAKNGKRNLSILAVLTILFLMCGPLTSAAQGSNTNADSTALSTSQSNGQGTEASQATATPVPTVTPVPTESPTQYKASATTVTVADMAKDPNSYKGKTIKFTAVIANFVQDSNGNTAGANVDDPNDYSSVVQIAFTPSFSLAHVNKGDTIEVWGQGMGAFSGTNAFGATITEGAVQEVYLHDSTTGYSDTTVTDPSSIATNSSN